MSNTMYTFLWFWLVVFTWSNHFDSLLQVSVVSSSDSNNYEDVQLKGMSCRRFISYDIMPFVACLFLNIKQTLLYTKAVLYTEVNVVVVFPVKSHNL